MIRRIDRRQILNSRGARELLIGRGPPTPKGFDRSWSRHPLRTTHPMRAAFRRPPRRSDRAQGASRSWPRTQVSCALIHGLLLAVRQGPSREEFFRSGRPVSRADRIIAGKARWPVGFARAAQAARDALRRVAVADRRGPLARDAPEFRSAGYASRLLLAAETAIRDGGAVLALFVIKNPELFGRFGWVECGRPSYLRVGRGSCWPSWR